MVIGQQLKEEGNDQNSWYLLHFTCYSFVPELGSVKNVFWTLNVEYALTFKGETFIVMLWCSGYQYHTSSFNKAWTQVLRNVNGWFYNKHLKNLIYLGYWGTRQYLVQEEEMEAKVNLFEQISTKLRKVRE